MPAAASSEEEGATPEESLHEGDVIRLFHSLKAAYSAAQRYQRGKGTFPIQEHTRVEIEGTFSADDIGLLNILRTGDNFKIVPERIAAGDFPSSQSYGQVVRRYVTENVIPLEEESLDEGVEPMELTKEVTNKLRQLHSHWSSKFEALHAEAEKAVADHDAVDKEIEAAMKRRRNVVNLEL